MDEKDILRKEKIAAREAISPDERRELSGLISERILASPEYHKAEVILSYRAVRGETDLSYFNETAVRDGKRVAYPLCTGDADMIALIPEDGIAFKNGRYGIEEPLPEKSAFVPPEDIDLVICPCTAFDDECHRMGMGAGYYDRYLKGCRGDAVIAAAAFEVQRAEHISTRPWDISMDMIFTENGIYDKK